MKDKINSLFDLRHSIHSDNGKHIVRCDGHFCDLDGISDDEFLKRQGVPDFELAIYKNVLETYWYIKSKQFSNKDDAFNILNTIEKQTEMIKELRKLVLEKQYLHTTDLRIKLERILSK